MRTIHAKLHKRSVFFIAKLDNVEYELSGTAEIRKSDVFVQTLDSDGYAQYTIDHFVWVLLLFSNVVVLERLPAREVQTVTG